MLICEDNTGGAAKSKVAANVDCHFQSTKQELSKEMKADVRQGKEYPSLACFGQCACLVPCCSCHGFSGLSGKAK